MRAAERFLEQIKIAQFNLATYPFMGFDGSKARLPNTRRMVVGEYYIGYRVQGDEVLVASIMSAVDTPLPTPDEPDDDSEAGGQTR